MHIEVGRRLSRAGIEYKDRASQFEQRKVSAGVVLSAGHSISSTSPARNRHNKQYNCSAVCFGKLGAHFVF